ncbi:DUF4344 domain-containing metallopeptidase [Pseudomarimonas arenosa]|uniref:Metallopeptidase DUF4344 n=1 Tax=Pseudomarimonas arenosa TaxID=2774145 RepID=A0AAW3ZM21_9GAMM|nr:DUF4344 domain-containing metallopeptidase [Pseudomarimonas arenosa]MBD8526112.1 hypothetical protein [Pseudomarimonas arenosa]
MQLNGQPRTPFAISLALALALALCLVEAAAGSEDPGGKSADTRPAVVAPVGQPDSPIATATEPLAVPESQPEPQAKPSKPAGKPPTPRKSFVERSPLVSSDAYRGLAEQMAGGSVLADVVQRLNQRIELPQSVALRFAECGEANAYFLPDQREVRLCFELFDQIADLLAQQVEDEAQLTHALKGVLSFVALHEVGHAVVAVRSLPMIGNEETAVDQFAVWLLVDGKDGDLAVLSAAAAFAAGMTLDDPAGAHASDAQRYYNLVCWLAGGNAKRKQQVMEDWALPASRAVGCEEEFRQLSQGWQRLLQPVAVAQPAAEKSASAETPAAQQGAGAAPAAESAADGESAKHD